MAFKKIKEILVKPTKVVEVKITETPSFTVEEATEVRLGLTTAAEILEKRK